jgi:hypothetical protein
MVSNLLTRPLIHPVLFGATFAVVVVLLPSLAMANDQSAIIAQATNNSSSVNPLQDFKTKDNYDPFSNSGGSVTPGFFELIHRATQGFDSKSTSEQGQELDAATSEFRNLQKKRLDPSKDSPVTPQATTPSPASSGTTQ